MADMPAIVLTCDRYHPLTRHMIQSYARLWPDHPLTFRVPYQADTGQLRRTPGAPIETVQTEPGIKQTVLSLLADIPDHEWLYWCIDDKYPIRLNVAKVKKVHQCILSLEDRSIAGIAFVRCRRWRKQQYLVDESFHVSDGALFGWGGVDCVRRKDYSHIWLHQFLRAGVLRTLFQAFPDAVTGAKELDAIKNRLALPDAHRLYVTTNSYAVFGESTSRGRLTANVVKSMRKSGQPIPETFDVCEKRIIIGKR